MNAPGAGLGVYVHVPFCAVRCDYCAFAVWTDRTHLAVEYVAACVTDLGRRVARGELGAAATVYVGGGTPSLLEPSLLARILDAVPRQPGAEVSVECNPDSVDAAKLAAYRGAGVTRVSIGAQSFSPPVLASLGRTHSPASIGHAVEAARSAGVESVSLDLIYGSAVESDADWERSVAHALALEPDHVSAYGLSVDAGSPYAAAVRAGRAAAPDEDAQADRYTRADELLLAAGLDWYEVSSWARPGHRCRHHGNYWAQGDYLGIGCAAHGHRSHRRSWNVRDPERYVARISADRSPEAGAEVLDAATVTAERLALELRTRRGIAMAAVEETAAAPLVAGGLLEPVGDRLVLTRAGRLVASAVTVELVAVAARA